MKTENNNFLNLTKDLKNKRNILNNKINKQNSSSLSSSSSSLSSSSNLTSNNQTNDKLLNSIECSEKLGNLLDVIDSIKPQIIDIESNKRNYSSINEKDDIKKEDNIDLNNNSSNNNNENKNTTTTTTSITLEGTNSTSSTSLTTTITTTTPISSPYDWIKHFDPTHSLFYYYNYKTGVTQWEEPEGFIEPIIITPSLAQNNPLTAEASNGYAATFNSRTGSFSSAGTNSYWESVGRPPDREGRQLSSFFNLTDLERNRAEAKMKKKELQVFFLFFIY